MQSKKEIQLLEELEKAAQEQGFDLVDLERTGSGRNALLRVYIDKEGGLTLDEVAQANTWISRIVEELDPYKGSYTLEVSSPGIDRPLRTLEHFQKAEGQEAVITLDGGKIAQKSKEAKEAKPRQKYTGTIVSVDTAKGNINLEADGVIHTLELAHIKKARIKGHIDFENRKAQ